MQIINQDQFASCEAFFSQPYSAHLEQPYRPPEQLIPFTSINKTLIGDRYGETSDFVPFGADYVSQVKWNEGRGVLLVVVGRRRPVGQARFGRQFAWRGHEVS